MYCSGYKAYVNRRFGYVSYKAADKHAKSCGDSGIC